MGKKRGGEPKRNREERQQDLNFIMPLFLKGVGFVDIAKNLNAVREYKVRHEVIVKDVQYVLKQWRKERINMVDSQMEIDLKKIDHLESVYWESWGKSKAAKIKTVQKERSLFDKKQKKTVDDYTNRQSEKHVTEYVGDKQWLDGVQWCIQQRAALLQYKKITPPGAEEVIPTARDVIFITRSRKNNDQFTDAVEVSDDTAGNDIQKLIQL